MCQGGLPLLLLLLLGCFGGGVHAAACDLASCTCDGVDLSGMKGQVYQAPTDSEGYAYKISMCSEIPAATLPTGCQQYAEHPAVVKYKANNPADCIEIGSIGPCSQGVCGMEGAKTANGVTVTYTYTYGCKNTFAMSLTAGSDPAPGTVTSNECAYSVAWAGLSAGGGPGSAEDGPSSPWGWYVIGFLILATGGYVGGGMYYNHKYNGEKLPSIEAVPNLEFWKQLPSLVKDGCIYSHHHGKDIAMMLHAQATGKPYHKVGVADAPETSEKASIKKASKKAKTPDYGGAEESEKASIKKASKKKAKTPDYGGAKE